MKRGLWMAAVMVFGLIVTVAAVNNNLGLPEEFADYHQWYRANMDKSFIESAHPVMKDVYFNEAAAANFQDGAFSIPFDEGSTFIKESLDPDTLIVSVMTVMRKTNNHEETNGWDYGMWERTGMNNNNPNGIGGFEGDWLPVEEAANMCHDCHARVQDQDYVFLTYLNRTNLNND